MRPMAHGWSTRLSAALKPLQAICPDQEGMNVTSQKGKKDLGSFFSVEVRRQSPGRKPHPYG